LTPIESKKWNDLWEDNGDANVDFGDQVAKAQDKNIVKLLLDVSKDANGDTQLEIEEAQKAKAEKLDAETEKIIKEIRND
jgi:hypothetical protein